MTLHTPQRKTCFGGGIHARHETARRVASARFSPIFLPRSIAANPMSRIAIIGTGPLLESGVRFFSGQGLRTWHFARPLLDDSHEVLLLTHPIDDRAFQSGRDPAARPARFQGFDYIALQTNNETVILPEIERRLAEFRPDAVFGINPFAAYLACRQRLRVPVWADLNGYVPAEGQTHCRLYGSDEHLEHFWRMEMQAARRADRISTATRRQRLATLGELAIAGRLNRHNAEYLDFVTWIPEAVAERYANFQAPPPFMRGKSVGVPADAFILLWSGGFNTWTDVDTMHGALERVMAAHPNFHFAATGGAIAGHDEKTFERFRALAAASPFAARYHLLGWVEPETVDALYGESDLGISLDAMNYESMFGARHRLLCMMGAGLPVLTTRGTEIAEDIEMAGVGLIAPPGDPAALAERIEWAIANRGAHLGKADESGRAERGENQGGNSALRDLARRGREWALSEFPCDRTTAEPRRWAREPRFAPDNAERLRIAREQNLAPEIPLERVVLHSLDDLLSSCDREIYDALRRDERDLRAIRAKPIWRIARCIKRLFRP